MDHSIMASGRFAATLVVLALVFVSTISCSNMRNQPSFSPQEGPRLEMPRDSVPISGVAAPRTPANIQQLTNPVAADQDSLQKGQALFQTYCAMCHGSDGKGSGPVGQSMGRAADLTADTMAQRTDGAIFNAITNGFGRMPPFRNELNEEERWHLVNYVRSLRK